MDRIQMPSTLAALNADESTTVGLRLMRCFFNLRDRQHRRALLALAEKLVKEEEAGSGRSAD